MDKEINIELENNDIEIYMSVGEGESVKIIGNYNTLDNLPMINNIVIKGNMKPEDLGLIGNDTKIPTKTSDLHNDSGFLVGETDPTVPAWAKTPKKPTYKPDEIGIIANSEEEATEKLTKIKIGDTVYSVEGGTSYINVADSEERF